MNMFCPTCGRTRRFNPEVVGLTPKVCPYCIFLMEQNMGSAGERGSRAFTQGSLRPFGLTLVLN